MDNYFSEDDYQRYSNLLTCLHSNLNSTIETVHNLMNDDELKIVLKINEFYPAFKRDGDKFELIPSGFPIVKHGIKSHREKLYLDELLRIKNLAKDVKLKDLSIDEYDKINNRVIYGYIFTAIAIIISIIAIIKSK